MSQFILAAQKGSGAYSRYYKLSLINNNIYWLDMNFVIKKTLILKVFSDKNIKKGGR